LRAFLVLLHHDVTAEQMEGIGSIPVIAFPSNSAALHRLALRGVVRFDVFIICKYAQAGQLIVLIASSWAYANNQLSKLQLNPYNEHINQPMRQMK